MKVEESAKAAEDDTEATDKESDSAEASKDKGESQKLLKVIAKKIKINNLIY